MEKKTIRLTYTQKTDYVFLIGSLLILFFCILGFKVWYRLGFNLLFLGYFIFGEMRLATVFYAVLMRIILYPSALINNFLERGFKETEIEYKKIKKLKDIFERDAQKKSLLKSKKAMLLYSWFHLCFLTINAITIGAIFFQNFTQDKLMSILYTSFYMPTKFPINTTGYIPIVGNVDLSQPNMTLNLYSAIGAGVVGLVEVFLNKKIERKQIIKYIVFFPLGAYYLTYWVPSGFEFALVIFESLTTVIIIVENIAKSKLFQLVKGKENSQLPVQSSIVKPKNKKTQKEAVKNLIKEVIAEASQKEV